MTADTPPYSKTYDKDLPLFQQLGLKPFQTDTGDKLLVGEYKLPLHKKAKIKIFVRCIPEHIWAFEITTLDGEFFMLHTSAGALSEYWDTAFKFAEGTLILSKP